MKDLLSSSNYCLFFCHHAHILIYLLWKLFPEIRKNEVSINRDVACRKFPRGLAAKLVCLIDCAWLGFSNLPPQTKNILDPLLSMHMTYTLTHLFWSQNHCGFINLYEAYWKLTLANYVGVCLLQQGERSCYDEFDGSNPVVNQDWASLNWCKCVCTLQTFYVSLLYS